MRTIAIAISLVSFALLTASGCASVGKMPKMPWESDEPEYKMPIKMVVNWKDTIRYNPNDPPTRGFGGRIHFYDESNKPVQVQGQLTVYGYDESGPGAIDPERPDRKFVFEADKLESHYSMSKLGHSYSFWVPWDLVGGEEKEITLAPFFRTTNGQVLMSEHSKNHLPGLALKEKPGRQPQQAPSPSDLLQPQVSQVAYQNQTFSGQSAYTWPSPNESKLRTTTIALPKGMESRLRNGPANASPQSNPQRNALTPAQMQLLQDYQNAQQQMDRSAQRQTVPYNPGPYQGRAPQSMQFTPGINLQNYQPAFTNATEYGSYLSSGQQNLASASGAMSNANVPVNQNSIDPRSLSAQLQAGSQPTTLQAPVPQISPRGASGLQSPQSPTTWPPGLR